MKKPVFFLFLALSLASLTGTAWSQAGVADEYLAGYLLYQEAEVLEKSGKIDQAYLKYSEAGRIIDTVAQNHPTWERNVVDYRRKGIREALARIIPQIPEDSPLRKAAPAPSSNYPSLPRDDRSPPLTSGGAGQQLQEKTRRLDALDGDSRRLVDELEIKRASLERTQELLDQSRRAQEDLSARLRDAEARLAAGGGDVDARVLKDEITRLRNELTIANDSITANDLRFTELTEANEKANAEIATLRTERDSLAAERDQLATLLKDAETGEMTTLLAENAALKTQLKEATEAMRVLKAENAGKDDEIASLKNRIKEIEGQLTNLREENDEYKRRIATLADKLRKTSTQLSESVTKSREGIAEEIVKENEVLQGIIRRQLLQQARRRDAKQLVVSQIAKLGVDSSSLLESVERLAGESFSLTDAEREVLESPAFRELVDDAGGIALFHKADGNAAPPEYPAITDNEGEQSGIGLNHDLTQFAKAANYDYVQGNFPAAEAAYQRVLDIVPDNIYVLRNLGLTKLRAGKTDDAEQLFIKAITYDPDNDYSNFIIGYHYYKQEEYEKAIAAMKRVIEINPENAKAHHYLGVICLRNQMPERAMDEFQKVVDLDTRFADAHFNLAYLYLTGDRQDLVKAREHYRRYLICGGRSDQAMEQNLGS